LTLPNYITVFRILLVPFFFTSLIYIEPGKEQFRIIALTLFVIASFTDALDGFIARVMHMQSDLGRFLDPLADKLMLLSGFIGIFFVSALPYKPPHWVTVTIIFRDLFILIGLLSIFAVSGKIQVKPNVIGKVTTVFQMATILAVLLKLKMTLPISYATAVLTIISCLVYLMRDIRKLSPAS